MTRCGSRACWLLGVPCGDFLIQAGKGSDGKGITCERMKPERGETGEPHSESADHSALGFAVRVCRKGCWSACGGTGCRRCWSAWGAAESWLCLPGGVLVYPGAPR